MTDIIRRRQGYKGSKNPNWKGGIRFTSDGHLDIYKPDHHYSKNNRIPLHRLVYEYFHKCCLLPWVEIHHTNGVKTDNHKHNLLAVTKSEHISIHMKGNKHGERNMTGRFCLLCGSKNTYITKKGHQQWYIHKNGFICRMCSRVNQSQHRGLHIPA